jgi:gliding motility-associated-like protein
MKRILLLAIWCGVTALQIKAQVTNDDCFGATPLGTLGTPAPCPNGIGATSTFNNLTNVNSVTEQPYTTLINCQPSNNTPMASPATDVWYSFVNSGNEVVITINGNIVQPNIAIYQGTCNGLIGRGCAIGGGNTLTANFDQMVPGQTYYIQISGGSPTDQGSFTMTLQNINDCSDCLTASNLTVNPAPVNGQYQGGTTVTFCYTITQWEQQNTNWLHAVIPTFGNGWDLTTLTNLQGAATCDGGPGVWQWFNNVNTPNGNGILSGFFFDGDIVQGGPNGNPTDNFGDNCDGQVSWTFCWTITAKDCPPANQGDDLGIIIDTYGDGETGNWTNIACVSDPVYQFNASLSCCAPPQMTQVNIPCFGQNNGSATATPVGVGPYDFIWTDAGNNVIQTSTNQTGANTVNNLGPGTYTVEVTDQNTLCVTYATVTITQPTALQVLIGSTPASCNQSNGTATATPQGGAGPYDFTWTDLANNVLQTATNVAGANTCSNLAAGTYNIQVTDANGCVSNVSVTVQGSNGNLTATTTTTDETCAGACDGTASATASGGAGPYTYSWNTVPNQLTQTATGLCAGQYIVTFVDANQCSGTTTVTIASPPAVTAAVVAVPSTICIGQSSTLTATPGGGSGTGYTYTWNPVGTGTTQTVTVTPAQTTQYSVIVTDDNGCQSAPANVTVTLYPPLNVQVIAVPPSICAGANSTLTAVAGGGNGGPYTYTWLPAGTGTGASVVVAPTTTTTYTVTVDDGCTTPTASAVVTVAVNPNPTPSFTGTPLSGCAPLLTTFTNNTPNSVSCSWNFGDNTTSNNCGPVSNLYTAPGCYDVTLTVTDNNGCVGAIIMPSYVCAFENVVADFSATPQPTTIFNTNLTFTDLSTGNPTSWTWYFDNLGTSNIQNPTFDFPNEIGSCYDVILEANNANNCPDIDTLEVCIDPEFIIYFPNAFTPNGDGNNDYFIGTGLGIVEYEMWIFDRWGNMIYYTDNIAKPWDGTVEGKSGEIVQIDTYVWRAVVKDVFNKTHKYIGHVNVIK